MTNKVFAPALSQDLSFAVTRSPRSMELLVLFESGSHRYKDMVEDLGWSGVDRVACTASDCPKWRHPFGEQYPVVHAIGHAPPRRVSCGETLERNWACQHLGNSSLVQISEDRRIHFPIILDGSEMILSVEANMSARAAAFEARYLCAWSGIRDSRCPAALERIMRRED